MSRLVESACFTSSVRLQIAVRDCRGRVEDAVWGAWPDSTPVRSSDRFYAASLAKQVTGAAAALLVRDGRLDLDLPVAYYLPYLPNWARGITARHLIHHTAGLPAAGTVETAQHDWTEAFALAALRRLPHLVSEPGTAYVYSNLGYVLIAQVIAQVVGYAFPRFVVDCVFEPLGLFDMGFAEPGIDNVHQSALMGPGRPLTTGDGGLWSTAGEFSRWLHHQNRDTLGISEYVTSPGTLTNGDTVAYGWGLGLRSRNNQALLIHGGEWFGATARAVRSPSSGIAIAAMSSGASMEILSALVDKALEVWVPTQGRHDPLSTG